MRVATLTAAVALFAASVLSAQQAATTASPARRTVVTANPFALVALYLTGDVETRISPSVTVGGGASIAGDDEFDAYRALDAKVRYYPNEKALYGFSVAATVGLVSAETDVYDNGFTFIRRERQTRGTFGTELAYQWLLGPKDRFATVLGFGLKRIGGKDSDFSDSVLDSPFLPTARVNIGFAF